MHCSRISMIHIMYIGIGIIMNNRQSYFSHFWYIYLYGRKKNVRSAFDLFVANNNNDCANVIELIVFFLFWFRLLDSTIFQPCRMILFFFLNSNCRVIDFSCSSAPALAPWPRTHDHDFCLFVDAETERERERMRKNQQCDYYQRLINVF